MSMKAENHERCRMPGPFFIGKKDSEFYCSTVGVCILVQFSADEQLVPPEKYKANTFI